MKKLTQVQYQAIKTWMRRNTRELELAIWKYEFENGSREAVMEALSVYQNEDGGFGNKLEPDNWNPDSTPYTTAYAAMIIKTIDFKDKDHPVIKEMLRFLDSGAYFNEAGWQWTIPTNDDHPCAIWWAYKPGDQPEGAGTTAELVSFILDHAPHDASIYKKALQLMESLIQLIRNDQIAGDDSGVAIGMFYLLESLQRSGLDTFHLEGVTDIILEKINALMVTDPEKWTEYGLRPTWVITKPQNPLYLDNETAVSQELDWLIDSLPANDVWPIPWIWYREDEASKKAFAISDNWWKGSKVLDNLRVLKNFGRLETPEQKKTEELFVSLSFSGNCQEAINYYQVTLGAKVHRLHFLSEAPEDFETDEAMPSKYVSYSEVTLFGTTLVMSDGAQRKMGDENFWFSLFFDTEAEVREAFNLLAADGQVIQPLTQQFWASLDGSLIDRFGIHWNLLTRT